MEFLTFVFLTMINPFFTGVWWQLWSRDSSIEPIQTFHQSAIYQVYPCRIQFCLCPYGALWLLGKVLSDRWYSYLLFFCLPLLVKIKFIHYTFTVYSLWSAKKLLKVCHITLGSSRIIYIKACLAWRVRLWNTMAFASVLFTLQNMLTCQMLLILEKCLIVLADNG